MENILNQKDYKIVKQNKKVPVNVPLDLIGKFAVIHKAYPNLEWSGLLFAEVTGSVEQNNLTFNLKDFILMDLGSAGYTEFDMTGEYVEYQMDIDPEFKWNHYLLHSHHNMQTFYSGTDQNVFEQNCLLYNIFISVVVNNKSEFFGKVGTVVEEEYTITGNKLLKGLDGSTKSVPFTKTEKRKSLYEWECEFILENPYQDRINSLKQIKEAKVAEKSLSKFGRYDSAQSDLWYSTFNKPTAGNYSAYKQNNLKQLELFTETPPTKSLVKEDFVELVELICTDAFKSITEFPNLYENELKSSTDEEIAMEVDEWLASFEIFLSTVNEAREVLKPLRSLKPTSITTLIYNKVINSFINSQNDIL